MLPVGIPLLGPRFVPPTYLHVKKREDNVAIQPETAYLKPLNVIHPFYYPDLGKCPRCDSLDVLWDSWASNGHRDLHGVHEEEMAIGYQLQCKACKENKATHTQDDEGGGYCFLTTNQVFWTKWEHWRMPRQCLPQN